jgi:DNA processing protein
MTDGLAEGTTIGEDERIDRLRLIRSENVGPVTYRHLIERFGSARRALEALPELARRGGGRGARLATRAEAERELAAVAALGGAVVTMGEPLYPPLLAHTADAPPLLTVLGAAPLLARRAVAIVGARNASAAGRNVARMLARDIGAAGYAIVSGLARGIDAAAHEAALDGGTVAVLAGGVERIYPPENAPLLARIVDAGGAVVSEMAFRWDARARDFPRRNRIVSGLSLGVVVVEAAERSGSLITARLAGEQGREVFAVPGSPLDPRAAGSNRLLKDGAILVTEAADVVETLRSTSLDRLPRQPSLPLRAREPADEPGAAERDRIVEALGPTPTEIDVVIRESGASAGSVALVLIELELAGRLERHAGGRVSLVG